MRFTQGGIAVNKIDVPDVDACAVPEVKTPTPVGVPAIMGEVKVGEVNELVKVTFCEASILSAVTLAVCRFKTPEASPEVTSPPPPAIFAEIVEAICIPYKTTHLLPDGTVTVIPLLTVIGPVDIADLPEVIV